MKLSPYLENIISKHAAMGRQRPSLHEKVCEVKESGWKEGSSL